MLPRNNKNVCNLHNTYRLTPLRFHPIESVQQLVPKILSVVASSPRAMNSSSIVRSSRDGGYILQPSLFRLGGIVHAFRMQCLVGTKAG